MTLPPARENTGHRMGDTLQLLRELWEPTWGVLQIIIQVGLVASLIYLALVYLRNTPAAPMLVGIVSLVLVAWVVAKLLALDVIEYLIGQLPAVLALALVIIFQPEIRRALAAIGSNPSRFLVSAETNMATHINELVSAAYKLAQQKTGALVAIERDIGMRSFTEQGVPVHAPLTTELLVTIFTKNSPLHDGAVVIRNGEIAAATVILPVTEAPVDHELGTRHRAAIGLTEETDAVVIVVSEERGTVSLAHKGVLVRDVDAARLRRHLTNYLIKQQKKRGKLAQPRRPLDEEAAEAET